MYTLFCIQAGKRLAVIQFYSLQQWRHVRYRCYCVGMELTFSFVVFMTLAEKTAGHNEKMQNARRKLIVLIKCEIICIAKKHVPFDIISALWRTKRASVKKNPTVIELVEWNCLSISVTASVFTNFNCSFGYTITLSSSFALTTDHKFYPCK